MFVKTLLLFKHKIITGCHFRKQSGMRFDYPELWLTISMVLYILLLKLLPDFLIYCSPLKQYKTAQTAITSPCTVLSNYVCQNLEAAHSLIVQVSYYKLKNITQ